MTKKIAFLFPGQGSQSPGMGRDAAMKNSEAARLMEEASSVLGFGLRELCFDGPAEALKPTEVTQPALYAASAATLAVLTAGGIQPWAVAGHSLGEYTALYCACVFDFATGLKLVRRRGEAMAEAGAARPGAMAAILGLDEQSVRRLCEETSKPEAIVVPANFNEPAQTVISGDPAGVEAACAAAKSAGAKRALPLPVSGAFHSPLVAPAADAMREALEKVNAAVPKFQFVNNVDATFLADPEAIKTSLVRQITGGVRWTDTIRLLASSGTTHFVEVGSGRALSGMVKRIAPEIPCLPTDTAEAMDKVLAELGA